MKINYLLISGFLVIALLIVVSGILQTSINKGDITELIERENPKMQNPRKLIFLGELGGEKFFIRSPPRRHPSAYLSDAKLRINAYRELAEANTQKSITALEISGQRLMLQRNGSPILMDGSRYPRLAKSKPAEKLAEALEMLQNF